MDRPTLSRSTSRLPSSVSTRSMVRLASISSTTSTTSSTSTLTRPTLSSSRKASSTLKRSTTGFGLGRTKLSVLGDTSPRSTSTSSSSSAGSVMVNGKRKASDEGGIGKKVRLYSPEGQRLPTVTSRFSPNRPSATAFRPSALSTPARYGQHAVSSQPGGAKWVHPLAHTPNRVSATPPDEGNSVSSDEMLLGDSPVSRVGPGDTPMKTVQELRSRGWKGGVKVEQQAKEEEGLEDVGMKEESMEESMIIDDSVADTFGNNEPSTSRSPPRFHLPRQATPPCINPIFKLSTTPTQSPPIAPLADRSLFPTFGQPSLPAAPSPLKTSSLVPPTPAYTIVPSPRKGLSSISRFGAARPPAPALTSRPTTITGTGGQTSMTQFLSRPAVVPSRPLSSSSAAPLRRVSEKIKPLRDDMGVDQPETMVKPSLAASSAGAARPGGMLPPSRIPLRVSKPAALTGTTSSTSSGSAPTAGALKRSALGSLGVAARPLARSTTSNASLSSLAGPTGPSHSSDSSQADQPVRRKPSYPSSLGSGLLPRPRDRQISVPVPSHIIEPILRDVPTLPTSTSGPSHPSGPAREPLRSVSAPAARENQPSSERNSLSLSTRREGWMDTSRSLHGLSEALERLKVKKDAPAVEPTRRPSLAASSARSSLAMVVDGEKENILGKSMLPSSASSARLSAVHKPRYSVSGAGVSGAVVAGTEDEVGDKSLAAIVSSTSGMGCLKGVVAYVDVWTADGTDSSGIFADMLRSLGARVLSRPSDSCTHIIYKSGRPATLNWYRKQKQLEEEDPECRRPHIVGLSWVTRSKEAGKRLDEGKYAVEVGEEDVFAKRRKSMEPKSLSLAALSSSVGPGQSHSYSSSIHSGIAEAKRKSLIHAPKVGSPLKKGYKRPGSDEEMY
ncbi:uncharacterized protein MKK02DRAFT_44658 [Dioszegia hungarica]|uniref:BRCT domain-containing protein n=1 Tax=Dioszegia hungarica TaxID=4972 RepID=A0AA38HAU7_9TREE|nr:uncharacterized protein MKK02DRAFT_44658 [Dioszegia hungarica]KAI9635959.1 hypothetical protein MKK02DRAFT_44658 [Dioszegia hungarica]